MLRLAPAGPSMGCAEGFEKAWAAQLLFGEPVWATLGVERYSVVAWPSDTRRLTIYADNDSPGLSGARHFRDDHPEIETRLRYSAHLGEDVDRLYRAVAGDRDAAMRRLLEE
jgi:putative DNA primase/helicase